MKKTRRIIALVLALTFMFCFMAMSASAATTEIQPRGTCPSCINGYIESVIVDEWIEYIKATNCSNIGVEHYHHRKHYEIVAHCRNCGYTETSNLAMTPYCPHA